jgi:hypothetical protein
MTKIILFSDRDTAGLAELGLEKLYVFVEDDGTVARELGISTDGTVIHRHPGLPTVARHGLFDLQVIDCESAVPVMSAEQFEALWAMEA